MDVEVGLNVRCPFCGGEIRAKAKVCKHCKQMLDARPTVDGAGVTSESAAVLRELRAFVTERGLLRPEHIDPILMENAGVDAAALLGHLAAAGHLTALQVESVREGFRALQDREVARLLGAARARGLLTDAHVETGKAGFQHVIYVRTPSEYVVDAQLLTAPQLAQIGVRAAPGAASIRTWVQRAVHDPALRRPLMAGPGAALFTVPLSLVLFSVVGSSVEWLLTLFMFAPIVAVIAVSWSSTTTKEKAAWGGATFAFCLLVMAIADGFGLGHPAVRLEPECSMNGDGEGTCVFTNHSSDTGHACGRIEATCRGGAVNRSLVFCSGDVAGHRLVRRSFSVPSFDRAVNAALPYGGDWRNVCSFAWFPE